jgi:hypothetical protein
MKVYNYNDKGIFSGVTTLNDSDKNPLNKSEYLIPAKCTVIPIPEKPLETFHDWQWEGKEWKAVVNCVGVPIWDKETKEEKPSVKKIGESIDFEKYTTEKPDYSINEGWIKFDNDLGEWVADIEGKVEADKQNKILDLKDKLKELDIKKIRYLIEVIEDDAESGKKYYEANLAETVKLRAELIHLENESNA